MDELYQAEWCPHSHRVRQRFTELGVPFVAWPVPADQADREELRRRTGNDEIPVLIPEHGAPISGAEEIIDHLNASHREPADGREHRARAREHETGAC